MTDVFAFLDRLKKIPNIIENCELQKQIWQEKAKSSTAGGVTIEIQNKKTGEKEIHAVEKIQSSSSGDSMAVAVINYVDLERKIEALRTEKAEAEAILEQLEADEYDVLYKFFILEFRNYEIADYFNRSNSHIEKIKKRGLKNLQILIENTEFYGFLRNFT